MSAKKASTGQGKNKNDKGSSKNMADEIKNTQLGKAAKRTRRSQAPKRETRLYTGNNSPVGSQTTSTKRKVFRQWYTRNGVRRCQYTSGGKQCEHEARQGNLTCSAHSRLEQDVREIMLPPFGLDWMRRLKRDIKNRFDKDLDFWTFLPRETWANGWDLVDFVIIAFPEKRDELNEILEECGTDIRPAIRFSRQFLKDRFQLSAHEKAELGDQLEFLYYKWLNLEFYAIFGVNGIDSSNIRSEPQLPDASVRPPDNRSRKDLKKVPRSIKPEGRAMFLEVMAVDAETQLFQTQGGKRDRFGKTALDREISELYHEIRSLEREIANSSAPRPLLSRKVANMQAKLDTLVAKRKSSETAKRELETTARELRAKQAELLGGQLQGSYLNGQFVGPEKWYWKLSVLRQERNSGPKKKTGNRGKHASKKTSKKRASKGIAGTGHCATVRGRFHGTTQVDLNKWMSAVIEDEHKSALSQATKVAREENTSQPTCPSRNEDQIMVQVV